MRFLLRLLKSGVKIRRKMGEGKEIIFKGVRFAKI